MMRGTVLESVYWLDGELICCARRFRNPDHAWRWAHELRELPPLDALPQPRWIWRPFYAPRACSDTTSSTTSP